jgi:hypothetical protein
LTGGIGYSVSYAPRLGQGGTQIAGGAGGVNTATGQSGSFGQGGAGASGSYSGGGGGGGYYGGGGGADGSSCAASGGGGSGYIGGVTNGLTVQPIQAGFVANPITTGDGFARITRVGAGGGETYDFDDLSLTAVLSPVNNPDSLCELPYAPLTVTLANLGNKDYDFTQDNITIHYEISGVQAIKDSLVMTTGELLSGDMDDIDVIPIMVLQSGKYYFKIWVTSASDVYHCDDTIYYFYGSGKAGLPIEEYFAGTTMPIEFVSQPLTNKNGTGVWGVYHPNANEPIQSADSIGKGYVRFIGDAGTEAIINTRQLDIYGAVQPKIDFWYFHDSTLHERDLSRMTVSVVVDGVIEYQKYELFKKGTHGWKQYSIDLSPYVWEQCVYVKFWATNGITTNPGQYLDWIVITSDQDLAVTEIYVDPPVTACSLQNRNIYAVLHTRTVQSIDFEKEPTGLRMEIWSGTTLVNSNNYPLTSGKIDGNSYDTIKLASGINFAKGTYQIKAYLTTSIDANPLNDRDSLTLLINPSLKVTVLPISSSGNCLSKDMYIDQEITVENTGDMDITGIEVKMTIVGKAFYDTIKTVLHPKETRTVNLGYTVPAQASYYVEAVASMVCDPVLVSVKDEVRECVIVDDIEMLSFASLGDGFVGSDEEIAVRITNLSDIDVHNGVIIRAWIEDMNRNLQLPEIPEVLPKLEPGDTLLYTFISKYKVPNLPNYVIRVFIDKIDIYQHNDTIVKVCSPGDGITTTEFDKFVLGQNVPNPAKHSTMIEYSVPTSGEVVFNVHSVSGQLLYSQVLQSESGKHFIELNTIDFAAGVYFYSMEYKGQKFVKRMSVKK